MNYRYVSLFFQEPKTSEVFLAQPWLVLEEDEWCMNGTVGSLSVTPQHELNVYLTEVVLCIHLFVFVFCLARVNLMLTLVLKIVTLFQLFSIGVCTRTPSTFSLCKDNGCCSCSCSRGRNMVNLA